MTDDFLDETQGGNTQEPPQRQVGDSASADSDVCFRLLVQSVKEYAIFLLDPQGVVTTWNPGAERMKGWKAEEMIGKHFSCLYSREDQEAGKPSQGLALAAATGRFEEEGWRVRKDGSRFWAHVVLTALKDQKGVLRGFGKVTRDLTERKRVEQTLQEKNAELEKGLHGKDRILIGMSHELRTPLNSILGFAGTLLMKLPGPLTADQEKQLRTIQSSSRLLLSLINDLLDLAKIEAGRLDVYLEPVSCREVIQEVVATLGPLAQAKNLMLEVKVPPGDCTVLWDRRSLSQILINLTSNAVKWTDRGTVVIELSRHQSEGKMVTEISVTDSGIGITPEDQARLFQPFFQVQVPGKHRSEGSGLGLHLSRKLAELLNGEIRCRSEPSKGSTFTLVLRQP